MLEEKNLMWKLRKLTNYNVVKHIENFHNRLRIYCKFSRKCPQSDTVRLADISEISAGLDPPPPLNHLNVILEWKTNGLCTIFSELTRLSMSIRDCPNHISCFLFSFLKTFIYTYKLSVRGWGSRVRGFVLVFPNPLPRISIISKLARTPHPPNMLM